MGKRDAVTKVLVLSNNRVLKRAVETCLALEFDVMAHDDSQEAFHDLKALRPDVVVMDIGDMNMTDGHRTAKWLNDAHPGINAIFMMNFSDDCDAHSALSALVSGENFTVECMQGALGGIHSAIRDMAFDEPEYFMLGYRLSVRTETRELERTV